jgi:dienelactone hydrolase
MRWDLRSEENRSIRNVDFYRDAPQTAPVASELRIYPGQEHGFDSNGDPACAKDAWERVLTFFDRYLGK